MPPESGCRYCRCRAGHQRKQTRDLPRAGYLCVHACVHVCTLSTAFSEAPGRSVGDRHASHISIPRVDTLPSRSPSPGPWKPGGSPGTDRHPGAPRPCPGCGGGHEAGQPKHRAWHKRPSPLPCRTPGSGFGSLLKKRDSDASVYETRLFKFINIKNYAMML